MKVFVFIPGLLEFLKVEHAVAVVFELVHEERVGWVGAEFVAKILIKWYVCKN